MPARLATLLWVVRPLEHTWTTMANFPTDDPARVETLADVARPIASGQTADLAVQQFATALQKALSTRFQGRGTIQAHIQSGQLELRVNDPDLDPNAGTYVLDATITLLVKSIDGTPPSALFAHELLPLK